MQANKLESPGPSKRSEVTLFLFLTFILIPTLTVGLVGAYGFAIWISQMFLSGPPTG